MDRQFSGERQMFFKYLFLFLETSIKERKQEQTLFKGERRVNYGTEQRELLE